MEKIVVSDTNIFIDLISVNLLDGFFSLPWEIHTTDMIMKELKDSNQKAVVDAFRQLGNLKIKGFDGNEMLELMQMRKRASESSNASIQDCSVWKLAKNLNCSLLTGDNRLRKVVQKDNIEVHGILYLFDKMLEHQVINHETAITKLQSLFNINQFSPTKGRNRQENRTLESGFNSIGGMLWHKVENERNEKSHLSGKDKWENTYAWRLQRSSDQRPSLKR